MPDGDVLLDDRWVEDADRGLECDVTVVESSDRPSGYRYSFQLLDSETGEPLLRYDNYHEREDIGWHHRHERESVRAITPAPTDGEDVLDLYRRFLDEVNDD